MSAANYNSMYSFYVIKDPLTKCLVHTKDFDSFAGLLKEVACGCDWFISTHKLVGDQESLEKLPSDFREITGRLLEYAIVGLKEADPNCNELIANIFQPHHSFNLTCECCVYNTVRFSFTRRNGNRNHYRPSRTFAQR